MKRFYKNKSLKEVQKLIRSENFQYKSYSFIENIIYQHSPARSPCKYKYNSIKKCLNKY